MEDLFTKKAKKEEVKEYFVFVKMENIEIDFIVIPRLLEGFLVRLPFYICSLWCNVCCFIEFTRKSKLKYGKKLILSLELLKILDDLKVIIGKSCLNYLL